MYVNDKFYHKVQLHPDVSEEGLIVLSSVK